MKIGIIYSYNPSRESGLIAPGDGGAKVFFRNSSICSGTPRAGAKVEFKPSENFRGPATYHVRILSEES